MDSLTNSVYSAEDLSFFHGINCLDKIEKCLECVVGVVEILFSHTVFSKIGFAQRFNSSVSGQTVFDCVPGALNGVRTRTRFFVYEFFAVIYC